MSDRALRVLTVFLAAVFVVFIGGVYVWESNSEADYKNAHKEYREKTEGYELERDELMNELNELEKEFIYCGDSTNIMVGFAVTSAADIEFIRAKSEMYGFSPTIVVDGTMNVSHILPLVETADADWEIMLYSPSLTGSTGSMLGAVKTQLEMLGRKVSSTVFLRIQGITPADSLMIKSSGFSGYTLYNDAPMSGQSEDGNVYFDFSRIATGAITIEDRLSLCLAQNASMIYVFEMDSIRSGIISEEQFAAYMAKLIEYSEKENCSFATVTETAAKLSLINQKKAELTAARDAQIKAVEKRVEELNGLIADIYDDCFARFEK